MPKNLLNDEELKQLVSGSEYLSGAFPDTRCPRYHRSRRASPPAGSRDGSRTRTRPGFEHAHLSRRSRKSLGLFLTRRDRARNAPRPARGVPEREIRTERARARASYAQRASLGAPLVPHRARS